MHWWYIPLIVSALSGLVVLVVLIRKIPQLRVIDVNALPAERVKQIKEAIIMQRFQRIASKRLDRVTAFFRAIGSLISRLGRRAVQRVYAMEQYYKKLQQGLGGSDHATDEGTIRRLMEEAAGFIKDEEYFQAEKRLIEIISHNPKHVKAYEELGDLYLLDKKYAQARETLSFAAKLDPKDASVQVSLGELEQKESNATAAVKRFATAVKLRPHNPRYLDFFIEAAIAAKDAPEARRGVSLLREVNPENQKLADFEQRIAAFGSSVSDAAPPPAE